MQEFPNQENHLTRCPLCCSWGGDPSGVPQTKHNSRFSPVRASHPEVDHSPETPRSIASRFSHQTLHTPEAPTWVTSHVRQ